MLSITRVMSPVSPSEGYAPPFCVAGAELSCVTKERGDSAPTPWRATQPFRHRLTLPGHAPPLFTTFTMFTPFVAGNLSLPYLPARVSRVIGHPGTGWVSG